MLLAPSPGTSTTQRYGDEHLSGTVRKLISGEESPAAALAFVSKPLAQLTPLRRAAQQLYADMVQGGGVASHVACVGVFVRCTMCFCYTFGLLLQLATHLQ